MSPFASGASVKSQLPRPPPVLKEIEFDDGEDFEPPTRAVVILRDLRLVKESIMKTGVMNLKALLGKLTELRQLIGASRAFLMEDRNISRVPACWQPALKMGKARVPALLKEAHEQALSLIWEGRDNNREMHALAVAIREHIEWAARCLGTHGDAPNNDDRMTADRTLESTWNLIGAA